MARNAKELDVLLINRQSSQAARNNNTEMILERMVSALKIMTDERECDGRQNLEIRVIWKGEDNYMLSYARKSRRTLKPHSQGIYVCGFYIIIRKGNGSRGKGLNAAASIKSEKSK